jgi:DNA-binding response OmpR family regulator
MNDAGDPAVVPIRSKDRTEAVLVELRDVLARAQKLLDELLPGNASSVGPDNLLLYQPLEAREQAPVLEESYRRARFGDAHVYLGKQEMALLRMLLSAKRIVSKEELLEALYPGEDKPEINIIAVYLSHLRKKLRPICGGRDPIQTVRGKGFRMQRNILPRIEAEGDVERSDSLGHC